ncbi:hypothetical protein ONZ45_g13912 [Pleurotus djamor]|nr:hypothetical protein ONZ45_g13912 [Pleurotus djamor]
MKVLIVGGGIAGLSAYHALRKHLPDAQISVYESHESPSSTQSILGGGLGLAPNGLRALKSVHSDALSYIQSHGYAVGIMSFRNSKGALLGRFWNGRKERYGFDQVLCPRAVVHEGLLLGVEEGVVSWGTKVASVKELPGDAGVEVSFSDGAIEAVDLVICADGVRSACRTSLFGEDYQAVYEGFTGIGGFVPFERLPQTLQAGLQHDPLNMTFGAQGFFGFGLADSQNPPKKVMWWSTYETSEPPTRSSRLSGIVQQLLARHGAWTSEFDSPRAPVFQTLINLGSEPTSGVSGLDAVVSDTNLLVLPRYICPTLPSWSSESGRIILVGDAAHALPSDSGQGVSCAVEDALCISALLNHFSADQRFEVGESVKRAAKAYEDIRMKRIAIILAAAKRRGDNKKMKTWWQEWLRDWMLWLLCRLPESINDRIMAYDIEADVHSYIESL